MADKNHPRIGDLLVAAGALTRDQVQAVLEQQQATGRPFGDLAERMFAVDAETVEKAWLDQYVSYGTEVDLNNQRIDMEVLRVLNRRQAWQFRMLPLRRENDELIVATTRDRLPKAVNFAWRRLHDPIYFLIAQRPQLEDFLMDHYPWPAMYEQMEQAVASTW
jgi:hypothetical protein